MVMLPYVTLSSKVADWSHSNRYWSKLPATPPGQPPVNKGGVTTICTLVGPDTAGTTSKGAEGGWSAGTTLATLLHLVLSGISPVGSTLCVEMLFLADTRT